MKGVRYHVTSPNSTLSENRIKELDQVGLLEHHSKWQILSKLYPHLLSVVNVSVELCVLEPRIQAVQSVDFDLRLIW
jgi:hypothetical protein